MADNHPESIDPVPMNTTNAILATLLVIVTLILGFFLFRSGFGGIPYSSQNQKTDEPKTIAPGPAQLTNNRATDTP